MGRDGYQNRRPEGGRREWGNRQRSASRIRTPLHRSCAGECGQAARKGELAMPKPSWSGEVSRKIVRRIVVEGDLVLQTPAHLGNGDGDNLIDMPLLTDPLDEKTPLLTGASIAGALRGYLHERENGFRAKVITEAEAKASPIVLLFGGNRGYDYGEQSPLIVEDAHGKNNHIELRDGVGLAGDSHTAAHDKLFNVEMWEVGTAFPLRFELVVRQNDDALALKQALATALAGLNN